MAFTNSQLAQKISDMIGHWSGFAEEYANWLAGTVGGGTNLDGKYPLTDWLGVKYSITCPAQLEDDVEGLVDSAGTFSTSSAASAVASAASATTASTQATLATTARTAAETAETNAETAESGATDAKVTAVAQAAAALASATAAATSATGLSDAVAEAEVSATASAASAAAAAASAIEAATFDPANFYSRTQTITLSKGDGGFTLAPSQMTFGYNGTDNQYRHGIGTRHSNGDNLKNAIDFYTWNFGVDLIGDIGTFRALSITTARTDVFNVIDAVYGVCGSYGDNTVGAANWGANIWSLSDGHMGSVAGPAYTHGTYGISWLRQTNLDALPTVDEGLYCYRGSTLFAAFGISGSQLATQLDITNITDDGLILLGGNLAMSRQDASWLRLNQNQSFTSGVYTPGNMRVDGTFDFGGIPRKMSGGALLWHATAAYASGRIVTSATAPVSPTKGDIWFDIS